MLQIRIRTGMVLTRSGRSTDGRLGSSSRLNMTHSCSCSRSNTRSNRRLSRSQCTQCFCPWSRSSCHPCKRRSSRNCWTSTCRRRTFYLGSTHSSFWCSRSNTRSNRHPSRSPCILCFCPWSRSNYRPGTRRSSRSCCRSTCRRLTFWRPSNPRWTGYIPSCTRRRIQRTNSRCSCSCTRCSNDSPAQHKVERGARVLG